MKLNKTKIISNFNVDCRLLGQRSISRKLSIMDAAEVNDEDLMPIVIHPIRHRPKKRKRNGVSISNKTKDIIVVSVACLGIAFAIGSFAAYLNKAANCCSELPPAPESDKLNTSDNALPEQCHRWINGSSSFILGILVAWKIWRLRRRQPQEDDPQMEKPVVTRIDHIFQVPENGMILPHQ